jgi:cell division protein FtsL
LSWTVAILATVAVTSSLIFVAWAKMQTVQYTYEIDEFVDAEEDLANRQRILRSELAALRSPAKLHALAPSLGLAPPEPGHVVVITGDPEGLAAALLEDDPPGTAASSNGDQP